jgi:hypothetical protein
MAEEKDPSVFKGKSELEREDFMHRLRDPNLYSKTNLGEEERLKLGEKLFGPYGSYIDRGEVEDARKELELGKWGKFKDFSEEDKEKAERLLKGILGE